MRVTNPVSCNSEPPIVDLVKISLERLGYPQIGKLSCEERDSIVILSGTLSSFYHSQMAQSIAAKVPGVSRVINQVDVCPNIN